MCSAYQDILGNIDEDPLDWWRRTFADKHYHLLKPAIKFLLSFGTGNAFLERCFSYAEHVTSDKRRCSYDLRRHMILRVTGYWAKIPMYLPFEHKVLQESAGNGS